MALVSMTGFGRGEASGKGLKAEVELSSVNRKQFDVRIGLPRVLAAYEARVQDLLHRVVSRGQVSGIVRVALSRSKEGHSSMIDRQVAAAYVRDLRRAAAELDLPDDLGASVLARLPDILQSTDAAQDPEAVWPLCRRAMRHALTELVAMRKAEGLALHKDLESRVHRVRQVLERIQKRAPEVTIRYRRSLKARIKDAGVSIEKADPQFSKELVLFAERSDISEELVRLNSHAEQFTKMLVARKPVGRAMDFVCQEMFREINTIGAKANDRAISRHVIQFKSDLESMREQVQNVE